MAMEIETEIVIVIVRKEKCSIVEFNDFISN